MKIVWTTTAELSFDSEIAFIFKKWSNKEVLSFVGLVNIDLKKLKQFPFLGKPNEDGIMHLVISKQTTLIYRILNEEIIELLLFWNNKQNPRDLEKAIQKLKSKF